MTWSRYLSDPLLRDFVPLEAEGARVLVRTGYERDAARLGARGVPEADAGRVEGGRQPHPVVRLEGGELAVVRRYRRGGLVRHLNPDRYFRGHRALEELRVTERARQAGVRAPRVLAAAERTAALGYTATLATAWIEGARELAGWLRDAAAPRGREALREAGEEVGRMHAAGIDHPDLNLRNFLVVERGGAVELFVIDFDRARLLPRPAPPAARARNLRRLARSARKLAAPIDAAGWRALREGYGADWPRGLSLG